MSYRTSETAVDKLIDVDSTIDIEQFIEVANELVTEVCSDSDYSDARLEKIERFLAAHLYTVRDPRVSQEAIGSLRSAFQGVTAKFFESSIYGQHALLLDTDGNLAALGKRIENGKPGTVGVSWIGMTQTEAEEFHSE